MAEMQNAPVWISRNDLVDLLTEIRDAAAIGDSLEGSFEYLLPDPGECPKGTGMSKWVAGFMVRASYRVGNLLGEGAIRMVGEMKEVPDGRAVQGD